MLTWTNEGVTHGTGRGVPMWLTLVFPCGTPLSYSDLNSAVSNLQITPRTVSLPKLYPEEHLIEFQPLISLF
jgi:hypothetical protein